MLFFYKICYNSPMKKLFSIIMLYIMAFLCIFLCGCTPQKPITTVDKIREKGVLTVGVKFDSKPFGFVENGEIKGLDIDIAKKIAKNILDDENKIEFVEVTSENRISKLMNEEIDIIVATMTDTQERRYLVDFSIPYYFSGQAILCKKDSAVKSAANLSNNNTVLVKGTTAEKTFRQYYRKSNVITVDTYKEGFETVKNNTNTCLIADEAILQGFIMDNPDYQIFNKKLSQEPYAIAMRKDEEPLKNIVDYTIKSLEMSGELEQIKDKWIKK